MSERLPAVLESGGAVGTPRDTYIVPALIADAGEPAAWRFVEFFIANINTTTRAALTRAHAIGSSAGPNSAASRLRRSDRLMSGPG